MANNRHREQVRMSQIHLGASIAPTKNETVDGTNASENQRQPTSDNGKKDG